jgi:hypothetical protein
VASPQDHLAKLSRSGSSQSSQRNYYVLQLQRGYGNRYVQRVLGQARKTDRADGVSPDTEDTNQRSRGSGTPLDTKTCTPMDAGFGADFDEMQVHTTAQADVLSDVSTRGVQSVIDTAASGQQAQRTSLPATYGKALLCTKASPVPRNRAKILEPQRRKVDQEVDHRPPRPDGSSVPRVSLTQMPKTNGTATAARSPDEPPAFGATSHSAADGRSPEQVPIAAGGPRLGRPLTRDGTGEAALDHAPATRTGGAPAGGGDGEGGTGVPPAGGTPTAAIDSGSAEGLLASLASVPVSDLGQAFGAAEAAAATIQGREKAAAQAAIPAIDQPTGLPAVAAPKAVNATELPQGQPPASKPATGRAGPPPEPQHPEPSGMVPGSQVSIAAAEPAVEDEDGGSWWSWLTDRLQTFFGSLPTTDPNVSTSAGPRQRVDLTGEADPAQSVQQQQASEQTVGAHRTQADSATTADFGENGILPTLPTGKLRPSFQPAPPLGLRGAPALAAPELPAKERLESDRNTAPWLQEHVNDQLGAYGEQRTVYERASEEAQEAGKRQLAEETNRTRTEQEAMRQEAQSDVGDQRSRWRDEDRKIQESFGDKATAKRQEIDRQIGEKVDTTHREADAKFEEAEKQAEAEKTKAETEAAETKREEESKPRSWWDSVKGAVSSAFNAIRSAITGIFDKLRKFVKGVIEAAKRVVRRLIEAARAAIVGLIEGFGEFVKGLVSIALAAFPELAAKARAWIDGRVKAATEAVNRAAEVLKRAADTILDGIAAAIDAALGILQAALLKALDVLEKLALLPFQAMEALAKLVTWVAENGQFVMAALKLEGGGGGDVIEALKNALGGMIAEVPGKAYAKLQEFAGQLGGEVKLAPATAAPAAAGPTPSSVIQRMPAAAATAVPGKRHVSASQHIKGILRHLDKGLEHLKNHWWDELKKVGWNLLWPWPAVWGDLKEIGNEVKAGFEDAYHLRVSKVIDHYLTIVQKFNSILGNLYGWFFIASVLIGAIIGAFFGGAGALPGALAGATFAGEVGMALVVALIATESAVIVKSVADLAIGNDTQEEDEEDYGKVGGSTLTIAITLAMLLLGEIAAKLAKSIWEGVVGLFKGEKAPEVKVEIKVEGEGAGGKGADVPEGKTGGEVPEGKAGEDVLPPGAAEKGVAAERTTPDGQKIKVLEDGRIYICTTCEELRFKFDEEIKASEDFQKKLTEAEGTADPQAKADKVEALHKELADARKTKMGGEDLPTKLTMLDEIVAKAEQALGKLKQKVKENARALSEEHGQVKGEVEAEIRQLEKDLQAAEADIETAKELGDPGEIDVLREKLDDVRAKSEAAEQKIEDTINPTFAVEPPRPHLKYPKNMLPDGGDHPYRSGNPAEEVVTVGGAKPGYKDADGNIWQVDPTKARAGKFFEWDVQTPDGGHINVGSDGSVTH